MPYGKTRRCILAAFFQRLGSYIHKRWMMYFGHEVFPWNLHQNFCYKLESGWFCGFFNTIVSNIKGIKITL